MQLQKISLPLSEFDHGVKGHALHGELKLLELRNLHEQSSETCYMLQQWKYFVNLHGNIHLFLN